MAKQNFFMRKIETKTGILILILCFSIIVLSVIFCCFDDWKSFIVKDKKVDTDKDVKDVSLSDLSEIDKFSSEQEFKEYLEKSEDFFDTDLVGLDSRMLMPAIALDSPTGMGEWTESTTKTPERVSETNVQTIGIDEPDIVKTDGKEIYFSPSRYRLWAQDIGELYIPPSYEDPSLKIIKSFPVEELSLVSEIKDKGDLLLYNNNLIIFSLGEIYGYDISNSESPRKKWNIKLERNNTIITSRLYNGKIYLIVRDRINFDNPCPIVPLSVNGNSLKIECTDIYYPIKPIATDVVYAAMVIDPKSGEVENKTSFTGSSGQSVVYMSENGIYITYPYSVDVLNFKIDFYKEKCSDIIPTRIIERMEKIKGYDISQQAKTVEIGIIFEEYFYSLDSDERMRIENEISNRIIDYYNENKRDLEKTGIIKIGIEGINILAHNVFSGFPLNQFALDEYQGNLRIATTVGERSGWSFGFWGRDNTANDIYVLDSNLNVIGSVKDLGLGERIYSARFIQDKGYLVTFRQIDPFYVLDLSNPQNPEVKGELKIPGYSSYLHPITENRILGIGKEDWEIKASLFDVSNPEDPKEIDKYILKENWSDALNNHHAFLLDTRHNIFFLPGYKGGYIFSYLNDKLELVKTISEISTKRAIYIDDYLYIIGDDKIVVLDEKNWERVKELDL